MTQAADRRDTDTPGSGDQPGEDLNVDKEAVATQQPAKRDDRSPDHPDKH